MMFPKFYFSLFCWLLPTVCKSFIFTDISKFKQTHVKLQHSSLLSNKYVNSAAFNSDSLFGKNLNQKEFLKKFKKEEVPFLLIKNSDDNFRAKAYQGLKSLDPFFSYTFTSIEFEGGKYGLLYCDNLRFKISRSDILKCDSLVKLGNDKTMIDSVFSGKYYLTELYRPARPKDISERTNGFLYFLNTLKGSRDKLYMMDVENFKHFPPNIKSVIHCRYIERDHLSRIYGLIHLENFFIIDSNKDSVTFVIPLLFAKNDVDNSSCFLLNSNFSFIPFFICYLNHKLNFDSTIRCIPDYQFSRSSELDSIFYLNLSINEHVGFHTLFIRNERIKAITKIQLYGLFQDKSQAYVFLISYKSLPIDRVRRWRPKQLRFRKYFGISLTEFLCIDSNFCIPKSSFGYCNFAPL